DVRVAQAAGGARLARKAVAQFGRVERGLQHLDRDIASDARIARAEQRAHAALADQVEDFVAPEVFWNLHNLQAARRPKERSLYRIGVQRRVRPPKTGCGAVGGSTASRICVSPASSVSGASTHGRIGARPGRSKSMTDEPLIRDISDTARWVAVYRARETDRPDAIVRDPFARALAGDRGEQIANALPFFGDNAWSMLARTYLFDRYVKRLVQAGVDLIVNLAAALAT